MYKHENLKTKQLSLLDCSEVLIKDNIINNDFKNEKHLQNYISDNIKSFCKDVFDEDYISHELEKQICVKSRNFGPRGKRLDIYLETSKNKYVIEIKKTKQCAEMRSAIGQLLDYGRSFDKSHTLVLLSNIIDMDTIRTIQHYNLNIVYIYISKAQIMVFKEFATPTQ
jgi:hypothetical protein